METWERKGPSEQLDYSWQVPIDEGDSLSATYDFTLASGDVTLGAKSQNGDVISIVISGGTVGTTALIFASATTAGGDVFTEYFSLEIIDRSAAVPVSPSELRTYLRDVSDADSILLDLIISAKEYFEEATGRATTERVEIVSRDAWPGGDQFDWWEGSREGAIVADAPRFIELPWSPLIGIDSIKTLDAAGNETLFDAANYYADTQSKPGRLALADGAVWPVPGRSVGGILIQYRAGYATAAEVPDVFKRAILQIAAHWYENRELVDLEGAQKIPMQAGRIISKYRIRKL